MRLEPTISTLTAIRSIQMAKRDSDGYRIIKYFTLKSILFIMFANLKFVLRSYTSLYGIFMSASLTLYIYNIDIAKLRRSDTNVKIVVHVHIPRRDVLQLLVISQLRVA